MKHVIIAGFDRCGSSMMGGLLAKHPDVSLMFQPTNGTEVHQDMLRPWLPREAHPDTYHFFNTLTEDKVDLSFIKRDVFWKHSECSNYNKAKLNVIKETKCCMKVRWLKHNVPDIAVYGIWREPEGILYSLVKNNFHIEWYGQRAFDQINYLVNTDANFLGFYKYFSAAKNSVQLMAVILAVSLAELKTTVDEFLVYEDIVECPNDLNFFITNFGLDTFNFSEYIKQDFNVSGKDFGENETWQEFFNEEDKDFFKWIFEGLR